MWRWIKWICGWVAGLVLGGWLVLAILTARTKLPGEEMTPARIRQSTSQYVKMRDGTEIAVTVDLPADLKSGQRVPVLMRTTRYWRAPQIGWTLRMLVALHEVGHQRLDVIGRTSLELHFWTQPSQRQQMLRQLAESNP
jgi:hypothetical protein